MANKIKITSYSGCRIRVNIPELRINRLFEKQGQSYLFDADVVEEMFYYPSVEKAFLDGLLFIEDKELRIRLGLEEEDGTVSENVVAPISNTTILAYLKTKTLEEFTTYVNNLPIEQQLRFVDVAVENKLLDYSKAKVLKDLTGKDIFKIIELNSEE